jgi:cell wall-associated NlpC family hydrolase
MTAARTASARRSPAFARRALVALTLGAGLTFASVAATAPAASAAVTAPAQAAQVAAPTQAAQVAVDTALAQQGKPYVWAGSGPSGFDCSGLTQFAYKAAGITLPRTSKAQATVGTPVARAALQPGDLVFFYSPISHVGIYIGNGQMVNAPSSGQVVKVSNVDSFGNFAGARRLA